MTLSVLLCSLAAFAAVPLFEVENAPTFDPAKAGWKCVFEDEFEGTSLDTNKWYRPHFARKGQRIEPDGQGHLVFHVEKNEKGVIPNSYIYSTAEHIYGYFEARVRFTDGLGWWAASWLHGGSKQNPFLDGIEIDTFEDFYTRLVDGHFLRDRIAHSIHCNMGDHGSSQQIHAAVPEPLFGWHVIACKWDPFSFSFYLDGQLTGSFNAFNNAACIRPLHAVLSAEHAHGTSWLGGKGRPGVVEGKYEVDYVKIWKDPDEANAPTVAWDGIDLATAFVPTGAVERLGVRAESKVADDPIDQYYLFDNGYLLDSDMEEPASFKLTMDEKYFADRRYGCYRNPGRGKLPAFDGYPHVLVAYARTKSGRVGRTAPLFRIPVGAPKSEPYEGKTAAVPGVISAWRFDVGGQDVAYHRLPKKGYCQRGNSPRPEEKVDCSKSQVGVTYAGEWINYSVDVAAEGTYRARFFYGSPIRSDNEAVLLVDGRVAATFRIPADDFFRWSPTCVSEADVKLPAGRHVLTVLFRSQMMFGKLEFTASEK